MHYYTENDMFLNIFIHNAEVTCHDQKRVRRLEKYKTFNSKNTTQKK